MDADTNTFLPSSSGAIGEPEIAELHATFILFGLPAAPYWFLGLEERDKPAKDGSLDAFEHTLLNKARTFRAEGSVRLRDLCPSAIPKYLSPPIESGASRSIKGVTYQRKWGGNIKLLLAIEMAGSDESWNLDDVKEYQKYDLGALQTGGRFPLA